MNARSRPDIRVLALGGGASKALNRALGTRTLDIPSIAANITAQDRRLLNSLVRDRAAKRLAEHAPDGSGS